MPKTKVNAEQNIKLPKSVLSKYCLKAGDILMIRVVRGSIILTPEKLKNGKRNLQPKTNGVSKNHAQPTLDGERNDWLQLSLQGLERAYGADEPEYTSDMIIEPNPEYERR